MLIDRLPLTEGWHLVALLFTGVALVGILHKMVKRRAALLQRLSRSQE